MSVSMMFLASSMLQFWLTQRNISFYHCNKRSGQDKVTLKPIKVYEVDDARLYCADGQLQSEFLCDSNRSQWNKLKSQTTVTLCTVSNRWEAMITLICLWLYLVCWRFCYLEKPALLKSCKHLCAKTTSKVSDEKWNVQSHRSVLKAWEMSIKRQVNFSHYDKSIQWKYLIKDNWLVVNQSK